MVHVARAASICMSVAYMHRYTVSRAPPPPPSIEAHQIQKRLQIYKKNCSVLQEHYAFGACRVNIIFLILIFFFFIFLLSFIQVSIYRLRLHRLSYSSVAARRTQEAKFDYVNSRVDIFLFAFFLYPNSTSSRFLSRWRDSGQRRPLSRNDDGQPLSFVWLNNIIDVSTARYCKLAQ